MKYISTRDKQKMVSPSEAIVKGIAEDGGLYVPTVIPEMEPIESYVHMSYKELAYEVLKRYFPDLGAEVLLDAIEHAYDEKFTAKEIAPLVEVEGQHYLELFHGPTFAFKDVALSILPYLLKASIQKVGEKKEIIILTATSGDTGKAALESFANIPGLSIIVFFPEDGVSPIQKKQMLTHEGENTFVVSINGDFDDAQTGVKKLMNDRQFIEQLEKEGYTFSSANSINIGRLVPQIVYYYHSYLQLLNSHELIEGERVNFVVPTGNFGNILAAYYAKKMGLPIHKLICASNENNVLTDFFNTGIYDANRELILTSSPSMDILTSSNLERLLFHLSGGKDLDVKQYMENLNNQGEYKTKNIELEDFKGYFATEADTTSSIQRVFEEDGYLIDPHTAVGHSAYEQYLVETNDTTKTVIVSTASPFKFSKKVAESIGIDTANKDSFAIIEELSHKAKRDIPAELRKLKDKQPLHKSQCNPEEMKEIVLTLLKIGE